MYMFMYKQIKLILSTLQSANRAAIHTRDINNNQLTLNSVSWNGPYL